MKRPGKDKYFDKSTPTKIDVARDKLYKINDPVQLSKIFFPNNDAKQKRAAFLAIIFEIRNSSYQKARPYKLNKIPKKYDINKSSFFKARSKMQRIGLIAKSAGYWKFSDGFTNAIQILIERLTSIRHPASSLSEDGLEGIYIETAKVESIYQQLRKKPENDYQYMSKM